MKIQSSISFGEKITEIPQVRYAQVSLSGTVFAFSYLIAFRLDCKKIGYAATVFFRLNS